MTGDYDTLAKDWVHLGLDERPSNEQIKAMLKEKTKIFTVAEVQAAEEKQKLGKRK